MAKEILFRKDATPALLKGINIAADAITSTLGYNGKLVIIKRPYEKPRYTKDGVTVARDIELKDDILNTGAVSVLEVCAKTLIEEGDGTTTSALLYAGIVNLGTEVLDNGANFLHLKSGLNKAVNATEEFLRSIANPVSSSAEHIKNVATISANNDEELGGLIGSAYEKVGSSGEVSIEKSNSALTYIDVVEGISFNKGYTSQFFVNNNKLVCELTKTYILIFDGEITDLKELLPLLEQIVKLGGSLLVIAEGVSGGALQLLLENHARSFRGEGGIQSCVVNMPYGGWLRDDILGDISTVTSSSIFSSAKGNRVSKIAISQLGFAEKVIISKDNTLIVGGRTTKEKIDGRKLHVEERLKEVGLSEFDIKMQHERLSKLSGGIGVIYVGGNNDTEIKERIDRVDDSIRATKSAIKGGIVPGGGSAYIRAIDYLSNIHAANADEQMGINIIKNVLEMPLKKILANGSVEANDIIAAVKRMGGNHGYNAKTNNVEDLIVSGVIDPVNVSIACLKNAAASAILFLSSDVLMVETK